MFNRIEEIDAQLSLHVALESEMKNLKSQIRVVEKQKPGSDQVFYYSLHRAVRERLATGRNRVQESRRLHVESDVRGAVAIDG